MFKMEAIGSCGVNGVFFSCYRDVVTDVLYLTKGGSGGMTVMMHPETGKPLTYTDYCNMKGGK